MGLLPLGEGWDGASMLAGTHPWQLHYLTAAHIATPMTFGLELPLLMGSQWVGHGLVIGIHYVDVVGVGWGRSWLVRTPGNFDRVAISQPRV